MTNIEEHPYSRLTPDTIIDAVESLGLYSDYRLYPLNSYENRVYQIGIEDAKPLIAKFYRPQRWLKEQIQEEHDALLKLADVGISVATPLVINGQSLFEHQGFYFSLSHKIIGEVPEAGNLDQLFRIGELIGALHQASDAIQLIERPNIPALERIKQASEIVLDSPYIPNKLRTEYARIVENILLRVTQTLESAPKRPLRFIHGDCHRSNVLLDRDGEFTLLDFDDCRMGYAVQDLWLHVSDDSEKRQQLSELIEGYESYLEFETRELDLIDVFMAERHIVYTAWIAKRWNDPAFPTIFPHFTGEEFWAQHLGDLRDIYNNWGNWR